MRLQAACSRTRFDTSLQFATRASLSLKATRPYCPSGGNPAAPMQIPNGLELPAIKCIVGHATRVVLGQNSPLEGNTGPGRT